MLFFLLLAKFFFSIYPNYNLMLIVVNARFVIILFNLRDIANQKPCMDNTGFVLSISVNF